MDPSSFEILPRPSARYGTAFSLAAIVSDMNIEERAAFVLAAAKGLFVNSQSTEQTVSATARLADVLGLRTKLLVRWGEVALQVDGTDGVLVRLEGAEPTGVNMDRVASVMRVIDKLAAGHLKPEEARAEIETVSYARPAPTGLFAIAAFVRRYVWHKNL